MRTNRCTTSLWSCVAATLCAILTPACFGTPYSMLAMPSASSGSHPTTKTKADLDAVIAQQTKDFAPGDALPPGRLESPAPVTVQGVTDTCYTIVMRLGEGATWGHGADAGLKFGFQSPTGPGYGGPGVTGPGAVVSLGCAKAKGDITLTFAPYSGSDPVGQGPYSLELWTHKLTGQEKQHLADDEKRQEQDAAAFEAKRKAEADQKCATCNARYQGCLGAGRSANSCRDAFSTCRLEEGADLRSCATP